jgi:hypothetical protein
MLRETLVRLKEVKKLKKSQPSNPSSIKSLTVTGQEDKIEFEECKVVEAINDKDA